MITPRKILFEDPPPPPVRTGPRRRLIVAGGALMLLALLLTVWLSLERPSVEVAGIDDDIIELIAPGRLTEDDLTGEGYDMRLPPRADRGWIEIPDEQGELAQRYRYESLDPAPPGLAAGWVEMIRPHMEVFLDQGRVLTLSGDRALARAPHGAVTEGTLTGDVILRLYEGDADRPVNVDRDEPALVVTTDHASFENVLGEIRCDGWVLIETPTMLLPGHRLSMLIDDSSNEVWLTIREPHYVRIVSDEREAGTPTLRVGSRHESARSRTPGSESRATSRIVPVSYTPAPEPRPTRFYLLTLTDDVRVEEGDSFNRRIAQGDRLEIVFSSQSRGFDQTLAGPPPPPPPPPPSVASASIAHMLAMLPMTSTPTTPQRARPAYFDAIPEPEPGVTIVTASGPLTIEPLRDDARRLASPEDARLELTGSPAMLCDRGSGSEVYAHLLTYNTLGGDIELFGSASHPLRVDTPEIEAGGERFSLRSSENRGGFIGGGWMHSRVRPAAVAPGPACEDDAVGPPLLPRRAEIDQVRHDRPAEVQITWDDGVDLHFDESSAEGRTGRIRSALFTGNVRVTSDDGVMTAHEMLVGFAPDGGPDGIESVHAIGDVHVVGIGTEGSLHTQDLHVDFIRSASGETVPSLMIATGEVQAIDEAHVIWSNALRVSFVEVERDESEEKPADRRGRGSVDVEELLAEGDVQVLLPDGTRAFSDTLIGRGVEETLELTGENEVLIVSERMVMDRGTRLIISRKDGKATSPGPGRFLLFPEPVLDDDRRRIEPPPIDGEDDRIELRAVWSESMVYDGQFNDGAGALDLRGDVDAASNPSPLEHNTITCQALTLEFAHAQDEAERDEAGDERAKRQLSRLIARNEAKLESRTWETERREGDPAVFYVAGDHVEHDAVLNESLVVGDGTLLIHDVRDRDEVAADDSPFGSRGTSTLAWKRKLHLVREVDDVYNATATGEVTLRHRDTAGAVSWLTCEQLDAVILRGADSDHSRDREGAADRRSDLDLGGSAKLERVRGTGGVIIHTPQREVECGEFDYDTRSGIAQLIAAEARQVMIMTRGVVQPIFAQHAVWDMQRDAIRIVDVRGGQ